MPNDERNGLPSASALHRYASCSGSWALESQCEEGLASNDAAIGNRIHAILAGEAVADLTEDEQRVVEMCRAQEADLVRDAFGNPSDVTCHREERLWAYGENHQKQWSGKPDVVYIEKKRNVLRALIIDYKTGRNQVEQAASNLQLRALAVLLCRNSNFAYEQIAVAIIQPLAGPFSVAVYDSADLGKASAEISSIMQRVISPNQSRKPSAEACRYCKGKPFCPEARESAVAGPLVGVPHGTTASAIAATLTNDTLAQFLDRATTAEAVIEACRDEARRRLAEGGKLNGWTLRDGAIRETIKDTETVYLRFIEGGGTYEDIMPAITLNKTKLKEALRIVTETKGRELDAKLAELLAGCTETKSSQPTLVRVK